MSAAPARRSRLATAATVVLGLTLFAALTAAAATPTPAASATPTPTPAASATPTPSPTLSVSPVTFPVSTVGWGDGMEVVASGFAPASDVDVLLLDAGVVVPGSGWTTSADASGTAIVSRWGPACDTPCLPHRSEPGETMAVVAQGIAVDGERVTSNTVPLTIVLPDPTAVASNESGTIVDGQVVSWQDMRRDHGITVDFEGFERDEPIDIRIVRPDGSSAAGDQSTTPFLGTASVTFSSDVADQRGVYSVVATGTTSGRTASTSFEVPAEDAPGIEILPTRAWIDEPFFPIRPSHGEVWGFEPGEALEIGFLTTSGVRQQLRFGVDRLERTADRFGWAESTFGSQPLVSPQPETYCVVAVGLSSGKVVTTTFTYGVPNTPIVPEDVDCSIAIAVATGRPLAGGSGGSGNGGDGGDSDSGPAVVASSPAPATRLLAATGAEFSDIAVAAPLLVAGGALLLLRRRREPLQ